ATGPSSATSTPAVAPAPVAVALKLNSAGKAAFAGILPTACVNAAATAGVAAIATSADSTGTTVILIPSGNCPDPAMLVVPLTEGVATATASVTPKAPTPSSTKP